jgi:hypothetical protein
MRQSRLQRGADYENSVFINCPFDTGYKPLFDAIVFAVTACGLTPRSALEIDDAGQTRIDKIITLIGDCRWGIHDISRVESNVNGLPRFNMPLELGIFLGARRFGKPDQKRKSCLVLDTDPFRFREFISDISGQDITPHGGSVPGVIKAIRNWLSGSLPARQVPIPGGTEIGRHFTRLQAELPELCADLHLEVEEITFSDYTRIVSNWLRRSTAP